ncbi:MAG: PDZ domain-containing protein [Chlamydiales bacterium]|nr:PDZ domain-containing protein [Chlamydiales bacterium]
MSAVLKYLLFTVFFFCQLYGDPRPLKITDIKEITTEMLRYHVDSHMLTPTLIKRSFLVFFDQFDQDKLYLLEEEVAKNSNISDGEAIDVIKQMRNDDYKSYLQLLQVCQHAVERERKLREEVFQDLLNQQDIFSGYAFQMPEYNDYAKSIIELKERIKQSVLFRIKIELMDQKITVLSTDQLKKQLSLFDHKDRRYESIFLLQSYKGKAFNKEKQDNIISTLILKSFARSLDAHTAFFSPEEAISMRASLQKQFKGIGVVIKEGLQGAYIGDLLPNGPAAKSKMIQKGDVLIQVNGKNVQDLSFEEVLDAMNSHSNGKITLVLRRNVGKKPEETVQVTLKKEVIVMENERLSFTTEAVEGGIIGKIDLGAFYDNGNGITAEKDLRDAILQMKQQGELKGLVIDLRNNAGGFLTQAIKVSGLFIPKGVIVISKYANGEVQYNRDINGRLYYQGPLVLLTSKASASAAEVVAQALQDYGVALIVGDERTYGKGSMQIQNITDEGAEAFFKVTVGRYYTISGRSTQIDGVIADIHVPTKYAPFNIGEQYLMYPLPRDTLGFSFLDQDNDIKKYSQKDPRQLFSNYFPQQEQKWKNMLGSLQKNSEERLKADKNFQAFLAEVEKIKKGDASVGSHPSFGTEDLQMKESVNIVKDMISISSKN